MLTITDIRLIRVRGYRHPTRRRTRRDIVGAPLSPVERRLFWYSGGVAQIVHDNPEPQVVRRADVETVTMTFRYDDEAATTLAGCMLRGSTGTELTDLGRFRKSLLRDLPVTADRTLAPRFVPPLNAPNGIFAPYLVAYAIRQYGIQVDGFIRGIPRPAALPESAPSSGGAEADY